MKTSLIIAAAFACLIIYLGTKPQSPQQKEAYALDEAIKECWKNHDKKSNTPSEKQFIALSCENLEQRKK